MGARALTPRFGDARRTHKSLLPKSGLAARGALPAGSRENQPPASSEVPLTDEGCSGTLVRVDVEHKSSGDAVAGRKVGPEIAMLLESNTAESHEQVDLVLQVSGDAAAVRGRLEELDATVRTVAGDVVTARCPIQNLETIAELDEVVYVELSRPLHTEDGPAENDAGPA